jgi:hypothetical protein
MKIHKIAIKTTAIEIAIIKTARRITVIKRLMRE